MDEQILKIYAEVEEIKKEAIARGYEVGEVKILADMPYVKISIDLIKRTENGTERINRISEEAYRDSKVFS